MCRALYLLLIALENKRRYYMDETEQNATEKEHSGNKKFCGNCKYDSK